MKNKKMLLMPLLLGFIGMTAYAGLNDGVFTTFYSANVTIKPDEKTAEEIPGLLDAVKFLSEFKYISSGTTSQIINTMMPTSQHTYYDISEEDLGTDVESRIIAELSRVTHVPADEIKIYAVTDTNAKKTLILPKFYTHLNKTEQMAVLFSQAERLLTPDSDSETGFRNVVAKEIAFQACAENPSNLDDAFKMSSLIGNWADTLKVSVTADLQNKVLKKNGTLFYKKDSIELTPLNLFGSDFAACMQSGQYQNPLEDCYGRLSIQAINLANRFPDSMFLKFWQQSVLEHKAVVRIRADGEDANLNTSTYNAKAFKFDEKELAKPMPVFAVGWSKKHAFSHFYEGHDKYKYYYKFSFTFDPKAPDVSDEDCDCND